MSSYFLCDECYWHAFNFVNVAWNGDVCLAPDWQRELAQKKVIHDGQEPVDVCKHFTKRKASA